MKKTWLYAVALGALLAGPASADVWDLQTDNDDTMFGNNQLVHGSSQTHDLGVRPGPIADQDWYLMPQKRQASYEVIVDGVSGDLGPTGLTVERIATGTQQTIVLTQNASERTVNVTFFYWNAAGTLLQQVTTSLGSKALDVFNVGSLPALLGQSGSITVAHDGGYGALAIKTVALEPATGFSFDTPGVYVPN